MEELKACPFCGNEAVADTTNNGTVYRVQCSHCNATIARPISLELSAKKETEDAWNRRVEVVKETESQVEDIKQEDD